LDKIGDLFASVNGVNAAPTKAQAEYYEKIREERNALVGEVRAYLGSLAALNASLEAEKIPRLLVPEGS
jgi:hypothetical protein